MRATLTTNVSDLVKEWEARGPAVRREIIADNHQSARILQSTSTQILKTKIYSVQIPTSRTGKPKWKRTEDLLKSELWIVKGTDIVGMNNSDHAEFRVLLGTEEGRPIKSPGIQRTDWQVEAVAFRRTLILRNRAEAIRRGLRKP